MSTTKEQKRKQTKEREETFMPAEPRKEHEWLEKLVGRWTLEGRMTMGPDGSTEKTSGTESVRSLGGLWFLAEGTGEMPGGGEATSLMTLGYDPVKERYVGTWIGSVMTHMWVYEGALDASGNVLTLETEGPDMSGEGGVASYRDVIEFRNDDHRVLTSHVLGEDGEWRKFVEVHYRRN